MVICVELLLLLLYSRVHVSRTFNIIYIYFLVPPTQNPNS